MRGEPDLPSRMGDAELIVVGASMGGMTAILFLLEEPFRTEIAAIAGGG